MKKFVMPEQTKFNNSRQPAEKQFVSGHAISAGTAYTSVLKYSKPDGLGTIVNKDLSVYQGEFVAGERNGYGCEIAVNNTGQSTEQYGVWQHNKFVKGYGTKIFPASTLQKNIVIEYEGKFINDMASGLGEIKIIIDGRERYKVSGR